MHTRDTTPHHTTMHHTAPHHHHHPSTHPTIARKQSTPPNTRPRPPPPPPSSSRSAVSANCFRLLQEDRTTAAGLMCFQPPEQQRMWASACWDAGWFLLSDVGLWKHAGEPGGTKNEFEMFNNAQTREARCQKSQCQAHPAGDPGRLCWKPRPRCWAIGAWRRLDACTERKDSNGFQMWQSSGG